MAYGTDDLDSGFVFVSVFALVLVGVLATNLDKNQIWMLKTYHIFLLHILSDIKSDTSEWAAERSDYSSVHIDILSTSQDESMHG